MEKIVTKNKPDEVFGIHNRDARDLDKVIEGQIVDVTVTSPPYYDLKNYGHPDQIGYGQEYDEYLSNLVDVFRKTYNVTKNKGSLWVIIDMFKRDGKVIPLPFDLVSAIKEIGWNLQEVIIWEKDRTVPWAHTGQMRNAFEYILVFSKSKDPKFHIERVKDTESLKHWWVRYPERYNPKGKSPASIWTFDIPTQGSWGNGYIRHFCPLPEGLISRILQITTDENDVVLDPFAGSGAVLSRAESMKRKFIGFELNIEYIEMFKTYSAATRDSKRNEYENSKRPDLDVQKFSKLILDLRTLKFARTLLKRASKLKRNPIQKILVERVKERPKEPYKIIKRKYTLLVDERITEKEKAAILSLAGTPPLSKFGIEADFVFETKFPNFLKKLSGKGLFLYTTKNTHAYKKVFSIKDLSIETSEDSIISDVKVAVDETLFK